MANCDAASVSAAMSRLQIATQNNSPVDPADMELISTCAGVGGAGQIDPSSGIGIAYALQRSGNQPLGWNDIQAQENSQQVRNYGTGPTRPLGLPSADGITAPLGLTPTVSQPQYSSALDDPQAVAARQQFSQQYQLPTSPDQPGPTTNLFQGTNVPGSDPNLTPPSGPTPQTSWNTIWQTIWNDEWKRNGGDEQGATKFANEVMRNRASGIFDIPSLDQPPTVPNQPPTATPTATPTGQIPTMDYNAYLQGMGQDQRYVTPLTMGDLGGADWLNQSGLGPGYVTGHAALDPTNNYANLMPYLQTYGQQNDLSPSWAGENMQRATSLMGLNALNNPGNAFLSPTEQANMIGALGAGGDLGPGRELNFGAEWDKILGAGTGEAGAGILPGTGQGVDIRQMNENDQAAAVSNGLNLLAPFMDPNSFSMIQQSLGFMVQQWQLQRAQGQTTDDLMTYLRANGAEDWM